jgi:hypothetical protein
MIRFFYRNIKRGKKMALRVKQIRKAGKNILKLLNLLASLYSVYTMAEPHIKKVSGTVNKV